MENTWWTQPEQLDDFQKAVVALPLGGDHLVLGPPGSGKTNLLVLRATHLYAAGIKNISVLTFGRVLREFLITGTDNYPFPDNKIQTYVAWGANMVVQAGGTFDSSGDFRDVRHRLLSQLRDIASRRDRENQQDCILLDEVQDYSVEEVNAIRAFAKNVFVVGDDKQRIYDESGSIEMLRSSISSIKELPYHYRNGIKICRVADGIRGLLDDPDGLEANSNYDEAKFPSTVTVRGPLSLRDQVAAAIPDIATQLRAYPESIIGVLSPTNKGLTEIWNEISASSLASNAQLQQFTEGYDALDLDRRIVVATIHGAKGLEFRALHLLGMDHLSKFKKLQKNVAYTAVTRAKTSLTIYHERGLPGYLESGIVGAQGGVVTPPPLADLFKRK